MLSDPALFSYPTRGEGRPQVVLYGNGLERVKGQLGWGALLNALRAPGVGELTDGDPRWNIPFPLLYQLLSTPDPAPSTFAREAMDAEEARLRAGLAKLTHERAPLLDTLPRLCADHILTTNYSYCLERTFFPRRDFTKGNARSRARFCLLAPRDGKPPRETCYRLHSGYLGSNDDGTPVGLWHIHGEVSDTRGIVVGHDRYGRLLGRIEDCSRARRYRGKAGVPEVRIFGSWPELFLFADVYVVGLGLETCEIDLWWLLRRKQRECYADGKVYFYDNDADGSHDLRDRLLVSHGVVINDGVDKIPGDYEGFYQRVLESVAEKIGRHKAARAAR